MRVSHFCGGFVETLNRAVALRLASSLLPSRPPCALSARLTDAQPDPVPAFGRGERFEQPR